MDVRFARMFKDELRQRKKRFKCTLRATKTKNGWVYTAVNPTAVPAAA